MYAMTGLYSENIDDNSSIDVAAESEPSENGNHLRDMSASYTIETKCHSRQPSTGIIDHHNRATNECDDLDISADCGILGCRPKSVQKFARIKVRRHNGLAAK